MGRLIVWRNLLPTGRCNHAMITLDLKSSPYLIVETLPMCSSNAAQASELPILSGLFEEQLRQLEYAGLAAGFLGTLNLKKFAGSYHVAVTMLEAAPSLRLAPRERPFPIVYNNVSWSSDLLCGYVGPDLPVAPRDVVASYFQLWEISLKTPNIARAHLLKCALWFFANTGQDLRATLAFLIDLYAHGYFATAVLFMDTLTGFAAIYSSTPDLAFLTGATRRDSAMLNSKLSELDASLEESPKSPQRWELVLQNVLDRVGELAEQARSAGNADEWLLALARLMGPVMFLSIEYHAARNSKLSITTRAQLSMFEEIGADLHTDPIRLKVLAEEGLRPTWEFPHQRLFDEYRARYPADEWLERVTGDRIVLRDVLRESVNRTTGAFDAPIPPGFLLNSTYLATALCEACECTADHIRSIDFDKGHMASAQARYRESMGKPAAPKEMRKILKDIELRDFVRASAVIESLAPPQRRALTAEFLFLYPWHELALYLEASAQSASSAADYELLKQALVLKPTFSLTWYALSSWSKTNGYEEDAGALRAIAESIARVTGVYP